MSINLILLFNTIFAVILNYIRVWNITKKLFNVFSEKVKCMLFTYWHSMKASDKIIFILNNLFIIKSKTISRFNTKKTKTLQITYISLNFLYLFFQSFNLISILIETK